MCVCDDPGWGVRVAGLLLLCSVVSVEDVVGRLLRPLYVLGVVWVCISK